MFLALDISCIVACPCMQNIWRIHKTQGRGRCHQYTTSEDIQNSALPKVSGTKIKIIKSKSIRTREELLQPDRGINRPLQLLERHDLVLRQHSPYQRARVHRDVGKVIEAVYLSASPNTAAPRNTHVRHAGRRRRDLQGEEPLQADIKGLGEECHRAAICRSAVRRVWMSRSACSRRCEEERAWSKARRATVMYHPAWPARKRTEPRAM